MMTENPVPAPETAPSPRPTLGEISRQFRRPDYVGQFYQSLPRRIREEIDPSSARYNPKKSLFQMVIPAAGRDNLAIRTATDAQLDRVATDFVRTLEQNGVRVTDPHIPVDVLARAYLETAPPEILAPQGAKEKATVGLRKADQKVWDLDRKIMDLENKAVAAAKRKAEQGLAIAAKAGPAHHAAEGFLPPEKVQEIQQQYPQPPIQPRRARPAARSAQPAPGVPDIDLLTPQVRADVRASQRAQGTTAPSRVEQWTASAKGLAEQLRQSIRLRHRPAPPVAAEPAPAAPSAPAAVEPYPTEPEPAPAEFHIPEDRRAQAAMRPPPPPEAPTPPREAPTHLENPFDVIETFKSPYGYDLPVYRVRYSPNTDERPYNQPQGLGKWAGLDKTDYPPTQQQWVIQPRAGQELVLKMSGTQSPRSLTRERELFLRSNQLFPQDARNRPVVIYGYGYQEWQGQQYILEELVNEGNFALLENYQRQHLLDQAEIAEIALGITDIVSTLNKAGIAFMDLNRGNVFWDPVGKRIRLIDAESARTKSPGERGPYIKDRQRVANIIFSLVAGTSMDNATKAQITDGLQSQSMSQKLGPLRRIVERAHSIGSENYGDPFTAEGTERMYVDLQQALEEIRRISPPPSTPKQ